MTKKLDNVSKFVLDFINTNKDADKDKITELWHSKSVQKEFKKNIKPKAPKKVKDIQKPIRSRSAYLIFSEDFREQIKTENPGINTKTIIQRLATLWKEKKETDKELVDKYEKLSTIDKERYARELKKYNQNKNVTKDISDACKKDVTDRDEDVEEDIDDIEKEHKDEHEDEHDSIEKDDETDNSKKVRYEDDDEESSDREDRNHDDDDSNKYRKGYANEYRDDSSSDKYESSDSESTSDDDSITEEEYQRKINEIKAFHIFMEKKTKKLKKLYPDLSSKEINDNLNRAWNKLSPHEKDKIIDKYLY